MKMVWVHAEGIKKGERKWVKMAFYAPTRESVKNIKAVFIEEFKRNVDEIKKITWERF